MMKIRVFLKMIFPTLLCSAVVMACLLVLSGSCLAQQVDCNATIQAWKHDVSLRQYLNDYSCDCSNGNSRQPVCTKKSSPSKSSGGKASGRKASGGVKGTKGAVLQVLKNFLDEQPRGDPRASEERRQTAIESALHLNEAQQSALQTEEDRRKQAAREEAAIRDKSLKELSSALQGMPASEAQAALDIENALNEDTRRKQLAEKKTVDIGKCESIAATITRIEDGIQRIDIIIGKNERFIKEAEEEKKKAVGDVVNTANEAAGAAAANALLERITNFVKAKDSLQKMKKGLDELEKFSDARDHARKLSKAQIKQAGKWMDNGLKYGDTATDLGMMGVQYYEAPRSDAENLKPPFVDKLVSALKDFNDKFMNDAGGWEFAGEHLAEYGGGPAGELAFKTTVMGVKLQVAAAGYLISDAELGEFRYNQGKMIVELLKMQQRVKKLRASLVSNNCPNQ
jgi:hypothetical protein